jgi:preprotein translocase subunit SecA
MQFLKEAVTWEAYAQKDPFLKYEERAQQVLNLTLKNFRDSTLFDIFAAEIL